MKKFLQYIWICLMLYRLGFYWGKSTHEKETWGFYRLCHRQSTILDIDFGYRDLPYTDHSHDYIRVHADADHTIYRWDA